MRPYFEAIGPLLETIVARATELGLVKRTEDRDYNVPFLRMSDVHWGTEKVPEFGQFLGAHPVHNWCKEQIIFCGRSSRGRVDVVAAEVAA